MHGKKRGLLIFLGVVILILIVAIYFTFFFYYKCNDLGCYQSHQEKCARTTFVNEQVDSTWQYKILGKSSGKCDVEVELLTLKQGQASAVVLEGEKMNCYLTIGSAVNPEIDLTKCHGVLKEELQNMIIQKLHKYILENVGKIGDDLNKAI